MGLKLLHPLPCSAILAHLMLQERLNTFGVLGCMLCIVGSLVIVLHAPLERQVSSVIEIWTLATRPGTPHPPCFCPSLQCAPPERIQEAFRLVQCGQCSKSEVVPAMMLVRCLSSMYGRQSCCCDTFELHELQYQNDVCVSTNRGLHVSNRRLGIYL